MNGHGLVQACMVLGAAVVGGGALGGTLMDALPTLSGRPGAELVGAALGAAVVAALAATRAFRSRMREVVAEVLAAEREATADAQAEALRTVVRDELTTQIRAALHGELAEPLRRLANLEGQVETMRGMLGMPRSAPPNTTQAA